MNESELLAATCFEAVRAPDRLEFVSPQSNGEPDFLIRSSEGESVGILEVTCATEPVYTSTLNELTPSRQVVAAINCESVWRVWPTPNANVNRLHRELDAALRELELAGISNFDDCTDDAVAQSVRKRLRLECGAITAEPGNTHRINLPSLGEKVDEDSVGVAICTVAARPDNIRKLSDESTRERHLFVQVDFSTLAAYYALGEHLELKPVTVHESITHLWAARVLSASTAIAWHAANGGPWTRSVITLRTGGRFGI